MLTRLRIQNFKSWVDTGEISVAPLTGLFGVNSSGKTAILQLLLLLKQTVESTYRTQALHLGNDRTYVNLGTFDDLVHRRPEMIDTVTVDLAWTLPKPVHIPDVSTGSTLFDIKAMDFHTSIMGLSLGVQWGPSVEKFVYRFQTEGRSYCFGMYEKETENTPGATDIYRLMVEGYPVKPMVGSASRPLPPPLKFYGFPDQVYAYYQNMSFLGELVLTLEEQLRRIYYLGPLRESPHRIYGWTGEEPDDIGQRGELAVQALLAAAEPREGQKRQHVMARVAEWLCELGLLHSFRVRPIAVPHYEVLVRQSPDAAEVQFADVGFGVSQILPVLTLCYYAPEGSTLILEQPDLHLHPKAQAGLADVFIDAIKSRNVQIILESHSEHLLRRLQRRIAEEEIQPEQAALYFINKPGGHSEICRLELTPFGSIQNWPPDFFGDKLEDLMARTDAAMHRQMERG